MCHPCASFRLKKNTQKQSLFPGIRKYPADLLLVAMGDDTGPPSIICFDSKELGCLHVVLVQLMMLYMVVLRKN